MGSKDQDYKEMFVAEALENFEELNKLFTQLEKNHEDKKAINHIFRITHTLKGNAMGMGFEAIADLAHVMEDVFSDVKEGHIQLDDDLFNNLFKANDKLGLLIDAINSGQKVNYKGIRTKLSVFLKNARNEREGENSEKPQEETTPKEEQPVKTESKNTTESLDDLDKDFVKNWTDLYFKSTAEDSNLSEYFEKADLRTEKPKVRSFLQSLVSGEDGVNLREAHEEIFKDDLNEGILISIIQHLTMAFGELNDAAELSDQITALLNASIGSIVIAGSENVEEEASESEDLIDDLLDEEDEDLESDDQPKIVFSDLVQVPVRKLDSLMNLVGELIIERDSLISVNSEHGFNSNMFARLQRITSDLQYGVMDVRLIQIGFLFNKFHRIVRDVASIEKKKVDLILEGTEIEIDRNILKIMSDSLIHLVRNSVSHGIETPEERKKRKKKVTGQVTLSARNEKDTVIIEISDDGAGIDPKAIGAKAVKMGLCSQEYINSASDDEIIMLIFEPGFSNADKITEVSGRGVGMDVVKRATESIGGNIKVKTELGSGSTISLSLPSSMAVKGALLFELNNQEYAVALSYTEAVVSLTKDDIHKVSNGLMASYLGKTISIIFLNDLYDISSLKDLGDDVNLHNTYDSIDPDKKLDVLVASYGNKYVGFVVDKLLQQKEIVEKTLEPPLHDIDLVSGATILGNGNVCLVLDIANIIGTLFKDKN